MSCLDDNVAAAFVQGLLAPAAAQEVEAHLESCSECRSLMIDFAQAFAAPTVGDDTDVTTPAEAPPIRRGDRLDRYVVIECVGTGGMSTVYSAYDPELDRKVALKVMRMARAEASLDDPRREQRLLIEARAIARLNHPNVVSVFDARVLQGDLFIAMELVPGKTLRRHLDSTSTPWREALSLCVGAGRGLAAAHRAGIIHRDFKPDNVLVGDDGRVRVADFGLATRIDPPKVDVQAPTDADARTQRETAPTADLTAPDDGPVTRDWPTELTRTGYVLGTPLYMAPEQMVNLPPSAASDQYALCLVTWEAVFGQPAFEASSFEELLVVRGRDELTAPTRRGVPAAIEAALRRGLQARPELRWPSVDALLDALAIRRSRAPVWTGVAATAALTIGGVVAAQGDPSPPCDQGAMAIATTMEAPGRARIEQHLPHGVGPKLATRIETWASSWAEAHDAACRATHVEHIQSEAVLDRRVGCLQRRRRQMETFIDLMLSDAHGDGSDELAAIESLGDLRMCADIDRLLRSDAPPTDLAMAATVEKIAASVHEARVYREAGRYAQARALAQQAVDQADATAHPPLQAQARLEYGRALAATEDRPAAAATIADAAAIAAGVGADDVAAAAWVALLGTESTTSDDVTARQREAFADAAVRRVGDPPRLRVRWLIASGALARRQGRLGRARDQLTSARDRVAALDEPLRHADILRRLAHVEIDDGRFEPALELIEHALALRQDTLGDHHPRVADAMQNYGNVLLRAGRFDDAAALLRQALAIAEQSLGPQHLNVAGIVAALGVAERRLGHTDSARALLGRAIEIRERALGSRDPEVADALVSLANIEYAEDRYPAARQGLERALSIYADRLPDDDPRVVAARANLAGVHADTDDLPRAEAEYRAVIAAREASLGADHPQVAIAQANLGQVLTAAGRPAEAVALLDVAVTTATAKMGPEHPFVAFAQQARRDAQRVLDGGSP
ncbi:MAG: tetratricopeptide repeat protein [Deltaproteobacteria bacterium]|nr:tetratricopeptide repeat protein [Deltaproteobacteria bacterium]